MFYVSNLYFIFIFYIHYTLTCTSILKLLLIDTIEENLIRKIDRKNWGYRTKRVGTLIPIIER